MNPSTGGNPTQFVRHVPLLSAFPLSGHFPEDTAEDSVLLRGSLVNAARMLFFKQPMRMFHKG
jgi:hypothetical protein